MEGLAPDMKSTLQIPPSLPPGGAALFDLDHTLLEGDCGQSWVEFLAERGLADAHGLLGRLHAYYEAYVDGRFDIVDYTRFQFSTIERLGEGRARELRAEWWEQCLRPRLRSEGLRMVERHRALGHVVVMATATHRFLVEPVSHWLEMDDLIATETHPSTPGAEVELRGVAAFGAGKLERALEWCTARGLSLDDCAFYSDSHNDVPLLSAVRHAFAVNPDVTLREHAARAGWQVLDWRHPQL
jgi:HAD superfamily hydrolase (TIGR01490 family)